MAGRVTARRLNRVEYNNTIRDLLGVAARPADEFPVDDSGYGFDNNGDVLSVSPMLMEKYMQAAENISRLAVYGEALAAETDAPRPADEPAVAGCVRRALGRQSRACICRIPCAARCTATSRSRSTASTSSGCASRTSAATTVISPTKREPAAPKSAESCSRHAGSSGRKRLLPQGRRRRRQAADGAVDRGVILRPKN